MSCVACGIPLSGPGVKILVAENLMSINTDTGRRPKPLLERIQQFTGVIGNIASIATPIVLFMLTQELERQKEYTQESELLVSIGKFLVDEKEQPRVYGTTLLKVIGKNRPLPPELSRYLSEVSVNDPNSGVANNAAQAAGEQTKFGFTPSPATDVTPRVYFHVRTREQRDKFQALANKLGNTVIDSKKIIVPGIQQVSTGPSRNEIRYFKDTDEPLASKIAASLNGMDQDLMLATTFVHGYEASNNIRPNHFELWVTSDAQ
jgi:hypothetical protein